MTTKVITYDAATDKATVQPFADQNEAQLAFLALQPTTQFCYSVSSLTNLTEAKVPLKVLFAITAAVGKPVTKFKTREIAEKTVYDNMTSFTPPTSNPAEALVAQAQKNAASTPEVDAAVQSARLEAETKAAANKAAAAIKAEENAAKKAAKKIEMDAAKAAKLAAKTDAKAAKVAAKEARKVEREAKKASKVAGGAPSVEQVRGRNGNDVITLSGLPCPKFGATRQKRLDKLVPGMTLLEYVALGAKGEMQNDLQVALWHGFINISPAVETAPPIVAEAETVSA